MQGDDYSLSDKRTKLEKYKKREVSGFHHHQSKDSLSHLLSCVRTHFIQSILEGFFVVSF